MNILVIGARLQGTEIVYLAKKANWTVHLVDKNPMAAAVDLCDYFYQLDIADSETMLQIFKKVNVVIPAIEDPSGIALIESYGIISGTLVISDARAFHISSSKARSNMFFKENQIPMPRDYEWCLSNNLPVIVKPSDRSGSDDVHFFKDPQHARAFIEQHPDYICQEYLTGPSYSIEVIGNGNSFHDLVITEIIVDKDYDCQRVLAPAKIAKRLEREFRAIALRIANRLKIKGIFDVEVIESKGMLYVLEIDARMPSQTPIAIYHATGINIVKELVTCNLVDHYCVPTSRMQYSILQHVQLNGTKLLGVGEHVMGAVGPLLYKTEYFEVDEALISNSKTYPGYVAELMVLADSQAVAEAQMLRSIQLIEESFQKGVEENDAIK